MISVAYEMHMCYVIINYIKSVCSTSIHTCSKHLLLGQTVKKHTAHIVSQAITGHYSMCTQTGFDGLLISLPHSPVQSTTHIVWDKSAAADFSLLCTITVSADCTVYTQTYT